MFVVRIAVAIYLVLATAVGPWPCCCAMPGSAGRTAGPERSGSSGPPSCCHAVKPRPGKSPAPVAARVVGGEDRPSGGRAPAACPCGERGCAAQARPDQARPVKSHSPTLEPSVGGGAFVAFVPTVAPALAGTSGYDRGLWCVADRLNGRRVLRC